MKKLIFIGLIFILNCNKSQDTFFENLKQLEYDRIGDYQKWEKLYSESKEAKKVEIILSVAKTRNDSVFNWLATLCKNEKVPEIKSAIVFALGQFKPETAENFLIQEFENADIQIKLNILKALEENGTKKSLNLLLSALRDDSLKNQALITAAIYARKKIPVDILVTEVSDSSWALINSTASAYFIYYANSYFDNTLITRYLSKSYNGEARKYYLRALTKKLAIKEALIADSALNIHFKKEVLSELSSQEKDWKNKIYALDLIKAFADSNEKTIILNLINSSNPHLKIKAISTLAEVYGTDALSSLISYLEKETDLYIKGQIIKAITNIDSRRGYRYIMQNINKGTTVYKELLLEALSTISDPLALQQLKNFLQVQDSKLVLKSFSLLAEKNRLNIKDVIPLLNNDRLSVNIQALDWLKNRNYIFTKNELFNLYVDDRTNDDDLQIEIINIIHDKFPKLIELDSLKKYANSPRVMREIKTIFSENIKIGNRWNLPDYLSIDSLANQPEIITVIIKTEKGDITLELYPKIAPLTVRNFVILSEKGYYYNNLFHRVIADFVIQGGDPLEDGWGGPGYTIPSEENRLLFERGTIGMATSGFDTGGSQFFICHSEQKHLRANYTAFGKVIDGMNVVDKILVGDKILTIQIL